MTEFWLEHDRKNFITANVNIRTWPKNLHDINIRTWPKNIFTMYYFGHLVFIYLVIWFRSNVPASNFPKNQKLDLNSGNFFVGRIKPRSFNQLDFVFRNHVFVKKKRANSFSRRSAWPFALQISLTIQLIHNLVRQYRWMPNFSVSLSPKYSASYALLWCQVLPPMALESRATLGELIWQIIRFWKIKF